MKSVILALLATHAAAQAPDGTAVVDGGALDSAGWDYWTTYLITPETVACDTDLDCALEDTNTRC